MIVVKDLKKNYNGLDVLKGIDLTINKAMLSAWLGLPAAASPLFCAA